MEAPSARVLVVGDSGVGKTALLQAISRHALREEGDASKPHRWTVGCDQHVLLHRPRDTSGGNAGEDMYIEFADVGGHPKYAFSRSMFYHNVHGIILVHDLSNTKSYEHLKLWLSEIAEQQRLKGCVVSKTNSLRSSGHASISVLPKLVIGNKRDLVALKTSRPTPIPETRDIEAMESSIEPLFFDQFVFQSFLDRVIAFSTSHGYSDVDLDLSGAHTLSADGLRQTKAGISAATQARSSAWW